MGGASGTTCPAAAALLPQGATRILDLTEAPGPPAGAALVTGVVAGDPEAEGFDPGGSFDAVLFGRPFELARDPARLLRGARSWLRAGADLPGPAGWPDGAGAVGFVSDMVTAPESGCPCGQGWGVVSAPATCPMMAVVIVVVQTSRRNAEATTRHDIPSLSLLP